MTNTLLTTAFGIPAWVLPQEEYDKLIWGIHSRLDLCALYVFCTKIGNGTLDLGYVVAMYICEPEALSGTHKRWCRSKQPPLFSSILYFIYFIPLDAVN
jgi:hypothetical protein